MPDRAAERGRERSRVLRAVPSGPAPGGDAGSGTAELLVAAAEAAAEWSQVPPTTRGRRLARAAADLETHRGLLVSELRRGGLSLSGALAEVEAAVDRLVWWAGWVDKLDLLPAGAPPGLRVERGPGVVLALAPAGHVLLGAVSVAAPVLVLGGACVLLPAAGAAGVAARLVEAAAAGGLPGDVLTLVPAGERRTVLAELGGGVDLVDARGGGGLDEEELRALRTAAARAERPLLPPAAEPPPGPAEGPPPDPAWLFPLRRSGIVHL
ncbi:hypothetical protein NUM3379_30370 [Kineococcus sp. NUM-3379]